jgi:plastocyanin
MRFVSRLGVFVLMSAALLGCSDSTDVTDQTVSVQDDAFNPSNATVSVGGTVTWSWGGSNTHNVTFVDPIAVGASAPSSATQATGSYHLTFNTAGSYDYYCTIHGTAQGTGMAGTITVQ